MAKRIFQRTNWTPTVTSDSTTALANGTYMGIEGASATQKLDILEIFATGLAGASNPTALVLARNGVVASTTTSLTLPDTDGPMDPASAALAAPVHTFSNAVGGPQRSASNADARLQVGINTFGGILRWNAAPTQQWNIVGNTSPGGSSSLSASNQGGGVSAALSSHVIYEPY